MAEISSFTLGSLYNSFTHNNKALSNKITFEILESLYIYKKFSREGDFVKASHTSNDDVIDIDYNDGVARHWISHCDNIVEEVKKYKLPKGTYVLDMSVGEIYCDNKLVMSLVETKE